MLTKKELEEMGKQFGVENITDTEYERNSKFSVKTALTRIKNERAGTAGALKKERTLMKGYLLGGRDFVYKGITLEQAKSQFVALLTQDENGKAKFEECTIWGHLHGDTKHGQGIEAEIELSKSTSDAGVEFENRNVRKVTVKKPEILTLKALLANGVKPRKADDLSEDDLYSIIFVEGEISNVEKVPRFDEGQIVDEFPLVVNGKPCVRLGLKTQGDTKVSIQLDPARLSEPFICFPDFMEVLKENDIESAINSFVGRKVASIASLRRYQLGEPSFITANAFALLSTDEPEAKPFEFPREKKDDEKEKGKKAPEAPKAPAPPAAPKAPPAPPTTQKETPPKEVQAPAGDMQVKSKVETIKGQVREALELLGVESEPSIADLRELKPELKEVKDPLLEAIAKKVREEMAGKK